MSGGTKLALRADCLVVFPIAKEQRWVSMRQGTSFVCQVC